MLRKKFKYIVYIYMYVLCIMGILFGHRYYSPFILGSSKTGEANKSTPGRLKGEKIKFNYKSIENL